MISSIKVFVKNSVKLANTWQTLSEHFEAYCLSSVLYCTGCVLASGPCFRPCNRYRILRLTWSQGKKSCALCTNCLNAMSTVFVQRRKIEGKIVAIPDFRHNVIVTIVSNTYCSYIPWHFICEIRQVPFQFTIQGLQFIPEVFHVSLSSVFLS